MTRRTRLHLKTLHDQVYDFLRESLDRGELAPGDSINLREMSEKLGISRTPLRFALLQLENDGFVSILPARGCVVNVLTLEEIRQIFQIIGALEASVILSEWRKITPRVTSRMRRLNETVRAAIEDGDFDLYLDANLKLHDCYLNLSCNTRLLRIVKVLKNRLYDFPRKKAFLKSWGVPSTGEHEELIRLLEAGETRRAADFLRHVHWCYEAQEPFVDLYYAEPTEAAGG